MKIPNQPTNVLCCHKKSLPWKVTELFPIEERRCLYKTWPHEGFHLICCNYIVDRFSKRKIEGKRGPLLMQGSPERDKFIFIWPEKISMDGFVCGKWTSCPGYLYKGGLLQFARKIKARFTNVIENEIASLVSIKTQFRLLVLKNHPDSGKHCQDCHKSPPLLPCPPVLWQC